MNILKNRRRASSLTLGVLIVVATLLVLRSVSRRDVKAGKTYSFVSLALDVEANRSLLFQAPGQHVCWAT